MAVGIGCIGFVLNGPLRTLIQILLVQWHYRGAWAPTSDRVQRMSMWIAFQLTFLGMSALPVVILLSYLCSSVTLRAVSAWMFLLITMISMKPMLQSYLEEALPRMRMAISQPTPTPEQTLRPFQRRYQRLLHTGSLIVAFPLVATALLTMGHLSYTSTNLIESIIGYV